MGAGLGGGVARRRGQVVPDRATPTSFAPFIAGRPCCRRASSACAPSGRRPRGPRPSSYLGPDVPVLVLCGRADLRTPLEDARRTAAQYPNASVLAVPGVGHSVLSTDLSGCAVRGRGGVPGRARGRQVLAHLARRAVPGALGAVCARLDRRPAPDRRFRAPRPHVLRGLRDPGGRRLRLRVRDVQPPAGAARRVRGVDAVEADAARRRVDPRRARLGQLDLPRRGHVDGLGPVRGRRGRSPSRARASPALLGGRSISIGATT